MEKIIISSNNVFDEKSKSFSQSKLAQRLRDKYTEKPYEERRKNIRILSIVGSFMCNVLAIVASASCVFGFVYGVIHETLPFPFIFASLASIAVLLFIEFAKRETVPEFFKDMFQYGFKPGYYLRILIISLLMSFSTFFSYKGGHQFVELVLTTPTYQQPILQETQETNDRYKVQIQQATRNAEVFKQTRQWRGKLSESDAKQYQKLLQAINVLSQEQNKEIQSINDENIKTKQLAQVSFEQKQQEHKQKLENRGSGFAWISFLGECLFLLFMWYIERFDYKTATQYAVLQQELKLEQEQQAQNKTNQIAINEVQDMTNESMRELITEEERVPIGFYHNSKKNAENLLQHHTQADTETKIKYQDKYTILHKGKRVQQRYTIGRINNIIKTYEERIDRAKHNNKLDVVEKNIKTLNYWLERKKELLEKSK